MHDLTRRSFVRNAALGLPAIAIAPELLAKKKKPLNRFQIGIQEYTFHRWLGSGKLKHLDYPALAKKELGTHTSSTGTGRSEASTPTKNTSANWPSAPLVRG